MKPVLKFSFIIVTILFSLFVNSEAQTIAATTSDEYTYGTVGYKMELQMRLPMKKGYALKDIGVYEDGERKLTFKLLMRDKEAIPCAVLLVYTKVRSAPEYFCLPTSDAPQDMWKQFYESLKSETENPEERFKFLAKGMTKLTSLLMP